MDPAARHPPPTDWERVFHPRAVALVGATGRADNPMARPLRWLAERGFAGRVHPVNPRHTELGGLPCVATLAEVPGPVDLVLALVPAARAVAAVEEAATVGAAAVVVFASGFAEVGPEGAALQEELVAAGRRGGVRVLGPNCQGLYHAPSRLFATFTAAGERPLEGSSGVAYVGQSGAIGGAVLDVAASRGLDLTAWVSTGNQADVDVTELGRHLVTDPAIDVLMVYAESIPDPAAYAALGVEAAAAGTALVVLRCGRSASGRRAAVSHTGAMLADDTAFTLVSRRHGIVLVDDVEELLCAATLLRAQARPGGRRVGVVTSSGGAGILAADRCAERGLDVGELAGGTQEKLALLVPEFGAVANPVDVTAQLFNAGGDAFGEVCALVRADPAVDALLVLLTMLTGDTAAGLAHDLAETVAAAPPGAPPCVVVWMAGEDVTVEARRVLREAGIPVVSSTALAIRVLDALAPRPSPEVARPALPPDPPHDLPGSGADDPWTLLHDLGVPAATSVVLGEADDAASAVRSVGGRAVLKALAPGLVHRTDAGGVRLDVTPATAADAAAALRASVPGTREVLVQTQVAPGLELLVAVDGGRGGWPPVLTVGRGGVETEVHRDTAHALAPVTPSTARALLRSLRCAPLLEGHRGGPSADLDAAADAVARLSHAAAAGGLHELEVNPLIVGPVGAGATAVDVLVVAAGEEVA